MMSFSLKSLPTRLRSLPIKSISLPFNLQRRERVILSVAGAVLALFIIAHLIIFPIVDRRARLRQQIVTRTRALQEMHLLKSEYVALTQTIHNGEAQLKNRPKGFTLFSFLDALAGKSGIKQNIIYMKPSTSNLKGSPYALSMVELKINALTMAQLVTFLHGVEETPNMIWIKRISISKGEKDNQLLNSILQVETFQL